MAPSQKSSIIVVSAPSGTGKTTLIHKLLEKHKEIDFSVSHTTRGIRQGETNGVDYHFISKDQFQKKIDSDEMLEWANVFGNLYGTSKKEIERISANGHRVVLDIDVQGWEQAKEKIPEAMSVFILPPSLKCLWDRLEGRGTDSFEVRWRRLLTAKKEIEKGYLYHHYIINDDLSGAYQELESIAINGQAGKIKPEEGIKICKALINEFDTASWLYELKKKATSK